MIVAEQIEGLGSWYNPLTWFEGKPAMDEQTKPIWDEVQMFGRVKTVCYIRKLQGYALDYLKIKVKAKEIGRADIATDCDSKRQFLDSFVDYLYEVIDFWFAGEGGREAPIPPGACDDGLGGWQLIGGAAVVGLGLAAITAWVTRDIASKAIAVGYCALTDSTERCREALKSLPPPPGETSGIITKVAIGAGVVIGGYVIWQVVQARKIGRAIASGAKGTAGLGSHTTYSSASRTAKRLLRQAQRAEERGESGKARKIYLTAEKHLRAADRLWQREQGAWG